MELASPHPGEQLADFAVGRATLIITLAGQVRHLENQLLADQYGNDISPFGVCRFGHARPCTSTFSTRLRCCTRATDDETISSQGYLYPGDPRVIVLSRSSSLRRTSSLTI